MFSVPPILNFVLRRYARTILSVFYSTTAKLTKNVQFVYLKKSKFQLYSNSFFDFFLLGKVYLISKVPYSHPYNSKSKEVPHV